jgi:predicted ABC-type ATPase
VQLSKSASETHEMLCEAFGEHSLSWTAVFERHCQLKTKNVQGYQALAKQQKILENSRTSMKIVAEYSMSKQTPLESVMEFARR